MISKARSQLAPAGVLYAGIFTGNPLLVSGQSSDGTPTGISPDLALHLAESLGVPLRILGFDKQNDLVDAIAYGRCGVGLVGSDPDRAKRVTFAPAYVEIPASFIVSATSNLHTIAEVDQPGVRIASYEKSAYDLWLVRHICHAEIVHAPSCSASITVFVDQGLEAVAGLRQSLEMDLPLMPNARLLDGQFMAVQQSIATANSNADGVSFLQEFVVNAKRSRLVSNLIKAHNVQGLQVPKD